MSSPSPDDVLLVGRLVAPFGVRGELKMVAVTTRPDHLATLKHVLVGPDLQRYDLKRLHEHKVGMFIISLRGIASREAAEELRGAEVFIRSTEAAPLDADEYFLHDLIGLQVRTASGDDLGRVIDVLETGANDVLIVRASGRADILVPMIAAVVRQIDLDQRSIEITALEDILPA